MVMRSLSLQGRCTIHASALVYKAEAAKESKSLPQRPFRKLRCIDLKGADFIGVDPRSTCYWTTLWRDVKELEK